jgi:quercetin dioxygenase-like cupin family protein
MTTSTQNKKASTFIPNLADLIEEIPSASIVSRTVYRDDTVKAVLFGFAAGEGLTEHTASQAAILHFLQGEATVTLGDGEETTPAAGSVQAVPGSFIHMPPKLPHSVVAHSDVLMLLLLLK